MKSRQTTSKFEPGALLRSICQAIHALTGGRSMVWVTVRQIEDRLGVATAELAPGRADGRSHPTFWRPNGERRTRPRLVKADATSIERKC